MQHSTRPLSGSLKSAVLSAAGVLALSLFLILAVAVRTAAAAPGDLDPKFSGDGYAELAIGQKDPSFGSNGASYLASVHCYSENDVGFDGRGRIYLGGVNGQLAQPGRSTDGSDSFFAARLLPSGSLDGSFGKGGVVLTKYHTPNNPYGEPAHLIVDARGRPVIAGTPGDHVALLRYTAGR